MADVLAILAKAIDSDRQGPMHGDALSRPDYPLVLANDRAIPLLTRLCEGAGATLQVINTPHVSLDEVRRAMEDSPNAIVTIYGHGSIPPSLACITNRRKEPKAVIADHSIIPGQNPALCVYACYSTRICENIDREDTPAFIGFTRKAYVPRIEQLKQCFEFAHMNLILRAYDDAYVRPTLALFKSEDANQAVFECQECLRKCMKSSVLSDN